MFDRFERSIGWKKARDKKEISGEYFDQIEYFSERIDQFLEAINRVNEINIDHLFVLDLYESTTIRIKKYFHVFL
jgi:hypothetical protein